MEYHFLLKNKGNVELVEPKYINKKLNELKNQHIELKYGNNTIFSGVFNKMDKLMQDLVKMKITYLSTVMNRKSNLHKRFPKLF